jgi:hypothetical protein
MADTKISALTAATTPLAGTEVLPIVQSGVTKQVSVADLTAGRAVSAASLTLTTTPLAATSGGTGQSSYAVGDLLYASTTTALSKLADIATGNALISGGVGVAPSWGKIGLTTHVSGTLGVGNGGTGITTTPTNGQIPIGNGTNYVAATLTAGAGIGITNAPGAVTVAVTGGPAFSVYRTGANQSLTTATFTKVQLNAEEYDTNNNFDSATNYRFTPTVAGYYQISGSVGLTGTNTRILCSIYKNGSEYFRGQDASVNLSQVTVTGLVYFNGSTDYVELYAFGTFVGTSDIAAGQKYTYLTGVLVRGA